MKTKSVSVLLSTAALPTINAQTDFVKPANETEQVAVEKNNEGSSSTRKQTSNYVRPTSNERLKRYFNNSFGVSALIGAGIGATIQQAANVPPDWKRNGNGLARRFGSNYGENAIQESVAFSLEEALKLDSKFYKSQKRDFGSRLKNALISSFTARTPSGKRVFNPSRIAGAYTANIISTETWYPKRYGYKDGIRQGTQTIGFNIGFDFLREFIFPK